MRLIRNPELKGILALIGVALLLGLVFAAMTGKLTEWFGIRSPFAKSLTNSIVFVSDRNGHPDIWVMDADGSNQRALTNDAYEDSEPIVSPDGYTIVFISKRDTKYSQIYAMDADGSNVHRLTNITGMKSSPSFSRDGKSVMFLCGGGVWTTGLKSSLPDKLLPTEQESAEMLQIGGRAPYLWAAEAADGKMIGAVRENEEFQSAMVMNPGDEKPSVISDPSGGGMTLVGEKTWAAWAHNSAKMFVTLTTDKDVSVAMVADFESQSITGKQIPGAAGSPDWSPDDNSVIMEMMNRDGPDDYESVGLLLADMSNDRWRVVADGNVYKPKWSPDGKHIVYTQDSDIMLLDPVTGKSVALTKDSGNNYDPSWAPMGK